MPDDSRNSEHRRLGQAQIPGMQGGGRAGVSEQGGVGGSVPWTGSARNGMPASRPYVWRRQGPVVPCPDHPGQVLCALPGGGARGTCPVDGASYQMDAPGAGR